MNVIQNQADTKKTENLDLESCENFKFIGFLVSEFIPLE